MNEIEKCPVCGGRLDLDCYDGVFGEEATFDCIPCGLTITGQRRFERIAAAMELAEALIDWKYGNDEEAYDNYKDAKKHVLEVFK